MPLPAETYDALREESKARGIHATTLDRARLTRRIGSLSPTDLDRLSAGLMAALELG